MAKKTRSIFFIQGGAGDVLAHTPMIRSARKKHPDDEIMVLSTYMQLWENNPHVDKVLPINDLEDFYQTAILDYGQRNVRFFKKHFIYDAIMDEPADNASCLPEFICNVFGFDYDHEPLDYFISPKESKIIDTFIGQYAALNKPLVLLQCTGAIPSDGNFNKTNKLKDADVKKVAEIVKAHSNEYLFLQIGLQGEPIVEGAIDALGMPLREAIALIARCRTFIFIESMFAHCSNALGKSGVVIFQNTSPKFFGYENNVNFSVDCNCDLWPCNRPVGALLDVLPGYRNPKTREKLLWECPDQKCAQWTAQDLDKAFLEALTRTAEKGNLALEAARLQGPPRMELPAATQKQMGLT